MTTNKRYELLKDLPDVKAGGKVIFDENISEYYVTTRNRSRIYFQPSTIEENSDWFREIVQPVTGLIGVSIKGDVVKYENSALIKIDDTGKPIAIAMNGMIFLPEQTAQPSTNKTERIEVTNFYFECHEFGNRLSYVVETNKSIPEEKYQTIKSAIEQVLNEKLVAHGSIVMNADRTFDAKESCWMKYTEDDLRKAFAAAKEKHLNNPIGEIHYYDKDVVLFFPERFKSFDDWKNKKQ